MRQIEIDLINRILSSVLSFFTGCCAMGSIIEAFHGHVSEAVFLAIYFSIFGSFSYLAFRFTIKKTKKNDLRISLEDADAKEAMQKVAWYCPCCEKWHPNQRICTVFKAWKAREELKQKIREILDSYKGLHWERRFYLDLGYFITDSLEDEKALMATMDGIIEQLKKALLDGLSGE